MNPFENGNLPREENVIVIYGDITNFAKLFEIKDNNEIFNLVSEFYELAGNIIDANGGKVVKLIGDSFIAIFPAEKAEGLLDVLKLLQKDVDELLKSRNTDSRIHISAHIGPVIYGKVGTKNDKRLDVFGTTVNDTCRIKSAGIEFSDKLMEYLRS